MASQVSHISVILTPRHWRPWGHATSPSRSWSSCRRSCWTWPAIWPASWGHHSRWHSWTTHRHTIRSRATRHSTRLWPTACQYLLNVLRFQCRCKLNNSFKRSHYRRTRASSWPAWAGWASGWWPRWPWGSYIWWHHYHDYFPPVIGFFFLTN